MPTASQIKAYLVQWVIPVLAGSAANWIIIHLHFLAAFHITSSGVGVAIAQALVFGVTAVLAWLTGHHVLKGSYAPAKK